MGQLAAPEHDAPNRLTDEETEQLVLRTVATQAESLLRVAHRHSLCADDAYDAYQRGMEIFMRRASTLDPASVERWLHVVVKHEAMEVRRRRSEHVSSEALDYEHHEAPHVSSPEERVLNGERATRAAEALGRLKPHELQAMWLKAGGYSYADIAARTGWSPTKVNRSLAEGRKRFFDRLAGIESGAECERYLPVLTAMVDGEASAEDVTDARPHLRNCAACRATLKGLRESERSFALVLPIGLVAASAKLSGLLERLMPAAAPAADASAAVGGAGVLGLGSAKLVGVIAAGAAAAAGGGLVVAHENGSATAHRPTASTPRVGAARAPRPTAAATAPAPAAPAQTTTHPPPRDAATRHRVVAHRRSETRQVEFAPAGMEPSAALGPRQATTAATPRSPTAAAVSSPADSSSGEFAPHP